MSAVGSPPPGTLPEVLSRAAEEFPRRGVALFDGRGRESVRRTYPEVLALARLGAGRLAACGVAPGDRVVVCLPTSWEWMESWLGAVLLGALPVAMAPPGALGASEAHVSRVEAVADRLDARCVVASESFRQEAGRLGAGSLAERCRSPEELADETPERVGEPDVGPDDVAFLQLTSGSTGLPRAVMIPHRAVMHNNHASNLAIGAPLGRPAGAWAESMVAWLPLHHDMGLVGCLFMSIVLGLDLWLLPPSAFLARPRLWLQQLASHGPAFSPAPNFGYQLCVERLRERDLEGLDLAGWKAGLVGAEMVRPETIAAFLERMVPVGFDPAAVRPCYGLAEATLAVTFDVEGRGLRTRPNPTAGRGEAAEVACVGAPVVDTRLRIAAPDGTPLPDGEVGEVRIQGPGVFLGYFNDPEATAEALVDGWFATGDLGFLHEGELYLTGRLKDILILRGHNLMPHEIEWLAEEVTGGGGVERSGAFSIDGGSEGEVAVVVVETGERNPETLAVLGRDIRLKVGHALSLTLADVAFVRRGRIPKTTSGKVQRRELKRRYLDGELDRY